MSPPERAAILPATDDAIARAAALLRAGEVVAMPTESVYGLAADATNADAVARVFAAKERPTFDPLIVHVAPARPSLRALVEAGLVDADRLSRAARERVDALLAALAPGPLTLVLPKQPSVLDLVTSGLPTVAVRVPSHPIARALLVATGRPLAAPSANRFGRISPTSAAAVDRELGDRIPLILDGGPCAVGVESTVIAIGDDGRATLLRPGGTPREAIEAVLGERILDGRSVTAGQAPVAPGMLASHYAPRKPLAILPAPVDELTREALPAARDRVGLLVLAGDPAARATRLRALGVDVADARSLSATGDRAEAARHLFATLRALDEGPAGELWAEPVVDETGLGFAIADRLQRAAVR